MRLLLALCVAGCAADTAPDPCAAVDDAAERRLSRARERGLADADLEQHRQAARAALAPTLAPGCRTSSTAVPKPPPPPSLAIPSDLEPTR